MLSTLIKLLYIYQYYIRKTEGLFIAHANILRDFLQQIYGSLLFILFSLFAVLCFPVAIQSHLQLSVNTSNQHPNGDFFDHLGRQTVFNQSLNINKSLINELYERKNATTLYNIGEVKPYITKCHNCTDNSKTFYTNNTIHGIYERNHVRSNRTVISRHGGFSGDTFNREGFNSITSNNADQIDKIENPRRSRPRRGTEQVRRNLVI